MNGKTLEKTFPKSAENCALSLKSIKERTTFLRQSVQIGRENTPAQSLALLMVGKTFARRSDPTRAKGQPTSQPHVKARLCDSVLPERGANKAPNRMKFTASLRQ